MRGPIQRRGAATGLAMACALAILPAGLASAQSGPKLTAAQLRKVLVGKSWAVHWGPFSSQIVFAANGTFSDGLNPPRRWHFAGDRICIATAGVGAVRENCLDFYAEGGMLTSFVPTRQGMAQSYHGPMP